MRIKKIAVVGMGTMGGQIGIVCATGGFQLIKWRSRGFVNHIFSQVRNRRS